MAAADHNAYLTFGATSDKPTTYKVVIISYSQGYNTQMNTATLRERKNYYPIRVKENDFQFTMRCRSEEEFAVLKRAVRKAHENALVNSADGICRIKYPELKVDYLGYITSSPEGVARFDYAPVLPLSMLLIKDTINTTTKFIQQTVDWKNIFGTNIVDNSITQPSTVDYTAPDEIMGSNKPSGGGGRRATAQ